MGFKRKHYVIDKKFQYRMSVKAVVYSMITLFVIGAVLLFIAKKNNTYTEEIVKNQDAMIVMFLTTPALQNMESTIVQNGEETFKENISMLVQIKNNSKLVLYIIMLMIVVQSVMIFWLFIRISHRISGPLYVMTNYLKAVREGLNPKPRALRDKDELKEFYNDLCTTIDFLMTNKKQQ